MIQQGDTYAIVINQVTPEHQGQWQLRAENIRGQAECACNLVVTGAADDWNVKQKSATPATLGTPPHFNQTLTSIVCHDGETVSFEAIVTGSPAPEITWLKNGNPFNVLNNPDIRFSNVNGRITLTFHNASSRFDGKYTCQAKNAAGVATSSAQFVVRSKATAPDFTQRLISREVAEGEQLKWTVKVVGDPLPQVVWLRNGQPIPSCPEVQLLQEGNGIYSLIIKAVEFADAGQFTALAENSAGEARSTADLVVRDKNAPPTPYYHVTKVTEGKQLHGKEMTMNEAYSMQEQAAAYSSSEQRQIGYH